MKALRLENIASKYHAGYVRHLQNREVSVIQTISFCNGVLKDIRSNNQIIADLKVAMVSPKDGGLFYLCDRDGNFISEDITPEEYSKLLGYSK